MTENLTNKIVAWAAETGSYAAKLPSRDARETYLTERREELLAGAVAEGASEGDAEMLAETCVNAARAIMTELLAQRAGDLRGRAHAMLDTILKLIIEIACGAIVLYVLLRHSDREDTRKSADPAH